MWSVLYLPGVLFILLFEQGCKINQILRLSVLGGLRVAFSPTQYT